MDTERQALDPDKLLVASPAWIRSTAGVLAKYLAMAGGEWVSGRLQEARSTNKQAISD